MMSRENDTTSEEEMVRREDGVTNEERMLGLGLKEWCNMEGENGVMREWYDKWRRNGAIDKEGMVRWENGATSQ